MVSLSAASQNSAYLIAGTALAVLAIWGVRSYRKVPTPLTRYFAITGVLGSIFFFANSLAFIFTTNLNLLRAVTNLGDVAYYSLIILQTRIIWYIGYFKRFNYLWLFLPTLALSAVVDLLYAYNLWHTRVGLKAGHLDYSWPSLALKLDTLLALIIVITGFFVLRLVKTNRTALGKVLTAALALAYIVGGANAAYNTLFLRGQNNSSIILALYSLVFGFFLVVSLIGQSRQHST